MVCAHVSWATLTPGERAGPVWSGLNILFGCVAPIYLLMSGVTLRLALEHGSRGETLCRHAWRMLRLLFVGVWLQVPILSLRQLFWNRNPRELAQLFDCNALHVIAIAGLLLLLLARLFPLRACVAIAGALAIVLLFTEPLLHALLPGRVSLEPPLRGLLGAQPAATLPLLPFALYPLAGFALGRWLASGEAAPIRSAWIALAGGVAVVAGFGLDELWVDSNFWQNAPHYLLFRVGAVLLALSLAQAWSLRRVGTVTTLVGWIGRGSLAIYIIHLVIVYGSPLTMGATRWWDGALALSLSPLPVALIAIVVLILTVLLWWCWLRLRRELPLVSLALKGALWAVFWGIFLARP